MQMKPKEKRIGLNSNIVQTSSCRKPSTNSTISNICRCKSSIVERLLNTRARDHTANLSAPMILVPNVKTVKQCKKRVPKKNLMVFRRVNNKKKMVLVSAYSPTRAPCTTLWSFLPGGYIRKETKIALEK